MSNNYKKQEIRDLYYIIYNNRLNEGIKAEDAKRIALDAASLRFGITNDRVRHILYDKDIDNPGYRTFIYMNNQEIINSLQELLATYEHMLNVYNESLAKLSKVDKDAREVFIQKIKIVENKIDKYNQLIGIIQQVNAHYCKQKK